MRRRAPAARAALDEGGIDMKMSERDKERLKAETALRMAAREYTGASPETEDRAFKELVQAARYYVQVFGRWS
jgi:hypothetical protein